MGPLSFAASDALAAFAQDWAEGGWQPAWSGLSLEVGETIGELIGASPASTIVTDSAVAALTAIDSCFRFPNPQTEAVVSNLEHSVTRSFWTQTGRYEERLVRSWDGQSLAPETVIDGIDERTAIVALSHCSPGGALLPLDRIVAAAHDAGAYVVVDFSNTAGMVPIGIDDTAIDFAFGRCDSWLLGGSPLHWIFVHPEIQAELHPSVAGWGPNATPSVPIPAERGIWRFQSGPPSPVALFVLRAGLDMISRYGVDNLRADSLAATSTLAELCQEFDLAVASAVGEDRGPVFAVTVPDPELAQASLAASGVAVGVNWPDAITVGPHGFNDTSELELLIKTLKEHT